MNKLQAEAEMIAKIARQREEQIKYYIKDIK